MTPTRQTQVSCDISCVASIARRSSLLTTKMIATCVSSRRRPMDGPRRRAALGLHPPDANAARGSNEFLMYGLLWCLSIVLRNAAAFPCISQQIRLADGISKCFKALAALAAAPSHFIHTSAYVFLNTSHNSCFLLF